MPYIDHGLAEQKDLCYLYQLHWAKQAIKPRFILDGDKQCVYMITQISPFPFETKSVFSLLSPLSNPKHRLAEG